MDNGSLFLSFMDEADMKGEENMVYSERTKRAMALILKAHQGQMDKGGYPYVYHPIHLAEQMQEESACLIALLHDVIEDCEGYTLEGVSQAVGLTPEEKESLRLITHDKAVPYMDYCLSLSRDRVARKVKIADLIHNLDLSRLGGKPLPKHPEMERCLEALRAIEKESGK